MDTSPVFLSAMVSEASEAFAPPALRPARAAVVVALQKVVTLTAVGSVAGSTGLPLHTQGRVLAAVTAPRATTPHSASRSVLRVSGEDQR